MSSNRYRINSPAVVHDLIDNEVVIIDFHTGSYYSLEGASALLWRMVAGGRSVPEIVEQFSAWSDEVEMATAVVSFLEQLEADALIVQDAGDGIATSAPPDAAPALTDTFTGFSWQKFSDMNHLLLLDPIHDVDTAGWPHLPADAPVTDGRQR